VADLPFSAGDLVPSWPISVSLGRILLSIKMFLYLPSFVHQEMALKMTPDITQVIHLTSSLFQLGMPSCKKSITNMRTKTDKEKLVVTFKPNLNTPSALTLDHRSKNS
jgi:hypothetical protein